MPRSIWRDEILMKYKLFIDGQWVERSAQEYFPAINPFTRRTWASIAQASEDQAIEIANDTDYGLAAGIWTTETDQTLRVSDAIRAGCIWVNTYRASAMQAPFGEFKDSGFGRERSLWALDKYLAPKNVMIDDSGEKRDPFTIKS